MELSSKCYKGTSVYSTIHSSWLHLNSFKFPMLWLAVYLNIDCGKKERSKLYHNDIQTKELSRPTLFLFL